MIRKLWGRMKRLGLAGIAGAALLTGGMAGAQDVDIRALQERLDRLEKQNEDLRARLTAPVATEEGGGADRKDVEKIVADYLKKQEADKKKADAAKASDYAEVGSDLNLKAKWGNGANFETPLKDFKAHFGGRVHFDMGWHDPEPVANLPLFFDAMGFRRARLRVDGTMYEVFNFVAEFEFSGANAVPTDCFIEVTQLPIFGSFRVGHFKEYFSLEQLTSSRFITFMDRTLFNEAFSLGFRAGAGFMRTAADDRMTVAAGVFRNEVFPGVANGATNTDFGDGEVNYVGRATVVPWWTNQGRCMMHLGAAYKHFGYSNDPAVDNDGVIGARYRARTLRIGDGSGSPRLIQSGPFLIDNADMFGGEFAMVWGPLSVQSEVAYLQNDPIQAGPFAGRSPNYWGCYIQASYFLTGEHRPYNKKTAAFDRVKPNEPFFLVKGNPDEGCKTLFGRGAWELAVRYDYLDLRDAGVVTPTPGVAVPAAVSSGATPPTGILDDVVFGVNWYWTSNAKVMFNYVRCWRDSDAGNAPAFGRSRDGRVDSFGVRFAWDF